MRVQSNKASRAREARAYRIRYDLIVAFAVGVAFMAVLNQSDLREFDTSVNNILATRSLQEGQIEYSLTKKGQETLTQAAAKIPLASDTNNNIHHDCPLAHTSKLSTGVSSIVIDKNAIRTQSKERLHILRAFTAPQYERFFIDEPGKEHYSLWHYLTRKYHHASKGDCRHVVDIGTRYVASALALGASGVPVKTFDVPNSRERQVAFRGLSETMWQERLHRESMETKIEFYNLDLLAISDQEFQEYMSTWLVILDTYHEPYSQPFEREFLERLRTMEPKFEGLLLLDDIHLNNEMKQWWKEVVDNADAHGYKTYDLSSVGHFSGTGLVDFSGKVSIVERVK